MLKKVLIISVIFFLIALGIAGYFIFFKGTNTPTDKNTDGENYFPFGPDSGNRPIGTSTSTPIDSGGGIDNFNIPINVVTQLSPDPATHGISLVKGKDTVVRYVERAQGHINEINLLTSTSTHISITTLPKIQDTLWLNGGNSLIYRYLSEIDAIRTYAATIVPNKSTTSPSTLKGAFLPGVVEEITASPDLKRIFTLEHTASGVQGVIANFDGTKRKVLWTSAISEWTVSWPETNTIILTTNASNNLSGYSYILNATTGTIKKLLGPIPGLTIKANTAATHLAYASNGELSLYNVKTGARLPTGLRTFTEKCVWSKKDKNKLFCAAPQTPISNNQPDLWYQGRESYSDAIFQIDAATGTALPLDTYKNINAKNIDVSEISLSPTEDYLLITNRKDSTLWSVNLNS
jgi:hypothetical protein